MLFFSVASFHLEKAGAHLTAAFCGLLGFMVLATCPAAPEKQMQAGWRVGGDHVLSRGSELLCPFFAMVPKQIHPAI